MELNIGYVVLSAWVIPAYFTWLWWLRQIDHDQEVRMKWGMIILATGVAACWFVWWPIYVSLIKTKSIIFAKTVELPPDAR